MTHAALVNGVVFWLVAVMTVLLVMFIYAVITTPPQDAAPAEPPALEHSALEWTAPASALPAQRSLAPASRAGVTGQPGGTGYPARHSPAAAPVISPPKTSSRPRWGPVGASVLAIAGLATAVTGGRMFLVTGQAPTFRPGLRPEGVALRAVRLTGRDEPGTVGGWLMTSPAGIGIC